jgi:hypothetical protein
MVRRVALVRTDVSQEASASIITVTRTGELGTMLVVTSNRRRLRRNTKFLRSQLRLLVRAKFPSSPILVTMMMDVLLSSEAPHGVNIPEDSILHSYRRENLQSYIALTGWTL